MYRFILVGSCQGASKRRQINERKTKQKFINMYMSHVLGGNAGMTNSKNWLELVLKYHLQPKTEEENMGEVNYGKVTRKIQ